MIATSTPVGLPAIFANTPIDLVPSQLIAEFLADTFLESIAIAPRTKFDPDAIAEVYWQLHTQTLDDWQNEYIYQ